MAQKLGHEPVLPPGMRLDLGAEQEHAHLNVWFVIHDDGRRTAWNGDKPVTCPVCKADPDLMPDCSHCAGRGTVDHVPYADRPWDEVIPNLWLGGHDCQMTGAPNGECLPGDTFDVVVSLYQRKRYLGAEQLVDERYMPAPGVEHYSHRMADADLDAEHHGPVDELARIIAEATQEGQKVLVRCQAGLNRSSLVTALAMLRLGWTADDAIARMREVRSPYVLFNQSFVEHIKRVEANMKESA